MTSRKSRGDLSGEIFQSWRVWRDIPGISFVLARSRRVVCKITEARGGLVDLDELSVHLGETSFISVQVLINHNERCLGIQLRFQLDIFLFSHLHVSDL